MAAINFNRRNRTEKLKQKINICIDAMALEQEISGHTTVTFTVKCLKWRM